jgi:MYXO-CTERM domain-containing protein
MSNTIIAETTGGADCIAYPGSTFTSTTANLVDDIPSNCTDEKVDLVGVDAKLLPLADNGGEEFTHALMLTSPAVKAGMCQQITDERGHPRLFVPTCDIGAYELDRITLTIQVIGMGTVYGSDGTVCRSFCRTKPVLPGTFINFTEAPAAGWTFVGWSGNCPKATGDCPITVRANETVIATFVQPPDAAPPAPDAAEVPDAGPDASVADAGADAGGADGGGGVIADAAPAADAATPVPDAAPAKPDASAPDATAVADAQVPTVDASTAGYDAKLAFDAGLGNVGFDAPPILPLDHGCSCGVGHPSKEAPSALMLFGLVALVIRRTRPRR